MSKFQELCTKTFESINRDILSVKIFDIVKEYPSSICKKHIHEFFGDITFRELLKNSEHFKERCLDYPQFKYIYINDFLIWLNFLTLELFEKDLPLIRNFPKKVFDFYSFLHELKSLKIKLVAKILFYDPSIFLADILEMNVEDIDFKNKIIKFKKHDANFLPLNVFNDLKAYLDGKESGRVFLGKQNKPLNPSTISRCFKEASKKIDKDYTSKSLRRQMS